MEIFIRFVFVSFVIVPVLQFCLFVKGITHPNCENDTFIIDELTSGPIYETNLMSFLNTNAKLLNYEIKDKQLSLELFLAFLKR